MKCRTGNEISLELRLMNLDLSVELIGELWSLSPGFLCSVQTQDCCDSKPCTGGPHSCLQLAVCSGLLCSSVRVLGYISIKSLVLIVRS